MKFLIGMMVISLSLGVLGGSPELVIYTTSSFATGVGKSAKENFEKSHKCTITYQSFSGVEHMLSRKGFKPKGDGVVGISYELLVKNGVVDLFDPLFLESKNLTSWQDPRFIPLFYALLGFVYDSRKLSTPPSSFEDLLSISTKIIITDPRTSNPGLGFLLWIKRIYGGKAKDFWKRLAPQILTIPKSWSESYALFMKGEAPVVLGFHTSPAYHRLIENKSYIKSIPFKEGNYIQYSVAGVFKTSIHKELFKEFILYLLSERVQEEIVFKDWSYPVRSITRPLPSEFRPVTPNDAPLPPSNIEKYKRKWLREWLDALSS